MPIACGSASALTGQEGSIYFIPPGTTFCLKDWTDFPAGTSITVPADNDYRVGDAVKFKEEKGGKLPTALTSGTVYYVVARTNTTIDVAAAAGGTAITLAQDGGTGTANSAGHINIALDDFQAVCSVRSFEISLERESLDVTTLPCGLGSGGGKYASFRATQAGYASGTGSAEVYFTSDQKALANRLLGSTMLRSQAGAQVRLYVSTVDDGTGKVDNAASLYIEAPISITGMSFAVNPDDATTATLNFSISGQPTHLFDKDL